MTHLGIGEVLIINTISTVPSLLMLLMHDSMTDEQLAVDLQEEEDRAAVKQLQVEEEIKVNKTQLAVSDAEEQNGEFFIVQV